MASHRHCRQIYEHMDTICRKKFSVCKGLLAQLWEHSAYNWVHCRIFKIGNKELLILTPWIALNWNTHIIERLAGPLPISHNLKYLQDPYQFFTGWSFIGSSQPLRLILKKRFEVRRFLNSKDVGINFNGDLKRSMSCVTIGNQRFIGHDLRHVTIIELYPSIPDCHSAYDGRAEHWELPIYHGR